MSNRRQILKWGLVSGASAILAPKRASAQLCAPDSGIPGIPQGTPFQPPSPKVTPFVAPLFVMPVLQPVRSLDPPPQPAAHQRYNEYPPKLFYEVNVQEVPWTYHPELPPSPGWGYGGILPGPTIKARYGEPIVVRMHNQLPANGVGAGLPQITTHLHNGHNASESDGYPEDYFGPGEFWDYHYALFPAGQDPLQRMNTLWYHDHMDNFTAANVYSGLSAFFLLFDDQDTDNENDPNPDAFRLPSGKYDVPLMLHDVLFDQNGKAFFDAMNTDGILGDRFTVNRRIQPFFQVERRKYRFRLLNGGPSRFYQISIGTDPVKPSQAIPYAVVTNDGNFCEEPLVTDNLMMGVANRFDIIVDFSPFPAGTQLYLQNRLRQTDPRGPEIPLKTLNPGDSLMRFDVVEATGPDHSRIPSKLRAQPVIPLDKVKQRRTFAFDYLAGLWVINNQIFDMNVAAFTVKQGEPELWTIRNEGNIWSHPIHIHMEEFDTISFNGKVLTGDDAKFHRKDTINLFPNDEAVILIQFRDFMGNYVMHCHNVVHEDHAMMLRFDVVP